MNYGGRCAFGNLQCSRPQIWGLQAVVFTSQLLVSETVRIASSEVSVCLFQMMSIQCDLPQVSEYFLSAL